MSRLTVEQGVAIITALVVLSCAVFLVLAFLVFEYAPKVATYTIGVTSF